MGKYAYNTHMHILSTLYMREICGVHGTIAMTSYNNSFGRNLYAEISKQRRNFIEFSEFMQLFRILCERSIQETIAAENTLARFASRKTSSDARVTPAEEKPTRSAGYVKRDEKRPARTAFPSKFHSLHEDLEQEDMQDGMYPADSEYVESEPYGEQADNMFAVDHKANKDYTKSGCFRFAVYGHCERKDCNRSHETKACEDYAEELYKALKLSRFCKSLRAKDHVATHNPNANRGGLQHAKPLGGSFKPHNVHTMQDDSDELDESSEHGNHEILNILENYFTLDTNKAKLPPMHLAGRLVLSGDSIPDVRVLFDTGASSASYISKDFLAIHHKTLAAAVRPHTGKVRVGDDHSIPVTGRLKLLVEFEYASEIHSAIVCLHVIDHKANHVVLGLPDICMHFFELTMQLLAQAKDTWKDADAYMIDASYDSDLKHPWSVSIETEPVEEQISVVPCAFPEYLDSFTSNIEDKKAVVLDALKTQCSPALLGNKRFMDMMKQWG